MYNKFKKGFKSLINFIKRYYKNNKVFTWYIIISVIELCILRLVTTNVILTLNPIFVDFGLVTIYGSLSFFFKNQKKRYIYLFCLLLLHTILCITNNIYYVYYASFASVSELNNLGQVKTVKEAFYEHLNILQFIYITCFKYIFFPIMK